MNAHGADFSKWDGGAPPYHLLDWRQYSWDFAFIKTSDGLAIDPLFEEQWAAARGYTLRGAYSYFRPIADPKEAVRRTLGYMDGDLGELPLLFDLETLDGMAPNTVLERARSWLSWYEEFTGIRPIVYSGPDFLNNVLKAYTASWLSSYKLMLAEYPFDKWSPTSARDQIIHAMLTGERPIPRPITPPPFPRVTFHQWTGKGAPEDVPGYYLGTGHKLAVDFIQYDGDRETLIAEFGASLPDPGEIEEPMSKYYRLNTTAANIRQGAGSSNTSLGYLTLNDVVQVDDPFLGGWAHLKAAQHANGSPVILTGGGTVEQRTDCWCTTGYLVEVAGLPNPPPEEPPVVVKVPFTLAVDGFKPFAGELEKE